MRIYLDVYSGEPKKHLGNPLSYFYEEGAAAKELLEKSREAVAKSISATAEEIIFTSCDTESNNLAIIGYALKHRSRGKHIITSSIEQPSVLEACKFLEKQGFEITYLPVSKNGFVSAENVKNAIRKDTILVSIQHANQEIGSIQDIKKIYKIVKDSGTAFHTDASISFSRIPVSSKMADLITLSSYRAGGPLGVSALYIRQGISLQPLLYGGLQEKKLRPGRENLPALIEFARAVKKFNFKKVEKLARLRDKIIKGALKIPYSWLNGPRKKRLPDNVNLGFAYIEGEALALRLNFQGIAVSTGSACTSGVLKPSHVLLALGQTPEQAHGSLRITLPKDVKEKDINYLLDVLPKEVEQLRSMSTRG